jgi:very-short-patch-repair endonuclease
MRHPFQSSKPSSLTIERARQMRCALTLSEQKLWSAIAGRRLGVTFRRQVPLGRFIADFAAPAAGLVVEVDGPYHARRRAADARRDRALGRMGYRVLRLDAELVLASSARHRARAECPSPLVAPLRASKIHLLRQVFFAPRSGLPGGAESRLRTRPSSPRPPLPSRS